MKLHEYMEMFDLSQRELADRANLSQQCISRLLAAKHMPAMKTLLAIHHATEGMVTLADFAEVGSLPPRKKNAQ